MKSEKTEISPFNVGFNTWVSSPPKDYLLKYIVCGWDMLTNDGIFQVMLDDVFPSVLKNRSAEQQKRITQLYDYFFRLVFHSLEMPFEIYYLSRLSDINEFRRLTGLLTISTLKSSMPGHKKGKFPNLNMSELLHPAIEAYAINLLLRLGSRVVLRGKGQQNLLNTLDPLGISRSKLRFVETSGSTEEYIESHIDNKNVRDNLYQLLEYWRQARLLKGEVSLYNPSQIQIHESGKKIVEDIRDFFEHQPVSLMLVGSSSWGGYERVSSDIDFLVFADEIILPPGFNESPHQVRSAYRDEDIHIVSVKGSIRGTEVSIRYLKPSLIDSYFNEETKVYWRQRPVGKKKEDYLFLFGGENDRYDFRIQEKPFDSGGYFYKQRVKDNNNNPLLEVTSHMILSGKFLVDNLEMFAVKLLLLIQANRNSPNESEDFVRVPDNVRNIILMRKGLEISDLASYSLPHEELSSLSMIAQFIARL